MSRLMEKTIGGEIHTQPYRLPFKIRERRAKTTMSKPEQIQSQPKAKNTPQGMGEGLAKD